LGRVADPTRVGAHLEGKPLRRLARLNNRLRGEDGREGRDPYDFSCTGGERPRGKEFLGEGNGKVDKN